MKEKHPAKSLVKHPSLSSLEENSHHSPPEVTHTEPQHSKPSIKRSSSATSIRPLSKPFAALTSKPLSFDFLRLGEILNLPNHQNKSNQRPDTWPLEDYKAMNLPLWNHTDRKQGLCWSPLPFQSKLQTCWYSWKYFDVTGIEHSFGFSFQNAILTKQSQSYQDWTIWMVHFRERKKHFGNIVAVFLCSDASYNKSDIPLQDYCNSMLRITHLFTNEVGLSSVFLAFQ